MPSSSTSLRVKELLRENGWTTKVLAEKTGMSESYLTHIKNGTRRWNEDSLAKLAVAFGVSPTDLFQQRRQRTDEVTAAISMPRANEAEAARTAATDSVQASERAGLELKVQMVPVVGDIVLNPSPYNNQLMQMTTGCRDLFVPVLNRNDNAMFALQVNNNQLAPAFEKGDMLIVSPDAWTRSGDLAAVEYGNDVRVKSIVKVTYTDEFILLESVNLKQAPIALVRNKDHFRIIGRVVARHQSFE